MIRSNAVIFALALSFSACSDKKFSSGGAGASSTASTSSNSSGIGSSVDGSSAGGSSSSNSQPVSSAPGLKACSDGDKVTIPWKGVVKDCFDQGKTYSFDTQSCVDIRKASFTCDWATVQGKLQEKGLLTETLKADAAAGAKLVNCSASSDGNRIAVQWVKTSLSPQVSCQNVQEGAGITTGCYTYYPDGNPPAPAQSPDELRQRVASCLKEI